MNEYECPDEHDLQESYTISVTGPLGSLLSAYIEGRCVCEDSNDMDEVMEQIRDDMAKQNYWPNIYYINDHGNIDLRDAQGNIFYSWL